MTDCRKTSGVGMTFPADAKTVRSAACVCGEINTRHCPVHGQGDDAAKPQECYIGGGAESSEHALVARLDSMLRGRVVVAVRDELPTSDPGWADHGSIVLVFDDGAELECGGWGHDAWGPSITYTPSAVTTDERERLRAQRDYYRRRWIIHGIHWRGLDWRKLSVGALVRAIKEDG